MSETSDGAASRNRLRRLPSVSSGHDSENTASVAEINSSPGRWERVVGSCDCRQGAARPRGARLRKPTGDRPRPPSIVAPLVTTCEIRVSTVSPS